MTTRRGYYILSTGRYRLALEFLNSLWLRQKTIGLTVANEMVRYAVNRTFVETIEE